MTTKFNISRIEYWLVTSLIFLSVLFTTTCFVSEWINSHNEVIARRETIKASKYEGVEVVTNSEFCGFGLKHYTTIDIGLIFLFSVFSFLFAMKESAKYFVFSIIFLFFTSVAFLSSYTDLLDDLIGRQLTPLKYKLGGFSTYGSELQLAVFALTLFLLIWQVSIIFRHILNVYFFKTLLCRK